MIHPLSFGQEAWRHLKIDLSVPLPPGHKLLIIIDQYSRHLEVEVLLKTEDNAEEIIKRLEKLFDKFGFPSTILVDNKRQFSNHAFKQYCENNNIDLINGPQC